MTTFVDALLTLYDDDICMDICMINGWYDLTCVNRCISMLCRIRAMYGLTVGRPAGMPLVNEWHIEGIYR